MLSNSLKSQQLSSIQDLQFRTRSCRSCGLCENRKVSIDGVGSYGAEILLVVDRTSVRTSVDGNIFSGNEGSILNNLIRLSKIDVNTLWVSTCVACPTEKAVPGMRQKEIFSAPKKRAIDACRDRLHEEVHIIDPSILISMGPSSFQALRGKGNFTQNLGRVVEANLIGRRTDYKVPMMVIDGVMTLLRSAQNPDKIWNKNLAYMRLAETISQQLRSVK